MNIVIDQVSQAERHGDDFHVPSLLVLSRCLDLYTTVLYDCLELGAPFDEVAAAFRLGSKYTEDHVREWVRVHGRIVIDEWLSPVGWQGHNEPIQEAQP